MINLSRKNPYAVTTSERRAEKFLMKKMGISKKELQEINSKSGVSFSTMIELMQFSKYEFVLKEESPGRCQPCKIDPGRITLSKFG